MAYDQNQSINGDLICSNTKVCLVKNPSIPVSDYSKKLQSGIDFMQRRYLL
jgi:hypothetical protein